MYVCMYVCMYLFIYVVFKSRVGNSDSMVSKVKIINWKINCKCILMESVVAYFQELSKHFPEGMIYSVKSVGVLVDIRIRQSENNIQKHYSLNWGRGVPALSDIHPLPRHSNTTTNIYPLPQHPKRRLLVTYALPQHSKHIPPCIHPLRRHYKHHPLDISRLNFIQELQNVFSTEPVQSWCGSVQTSMACTAAQYKFPSPTYSSSPPE